jgi:hypothetical protein
MMRFGRIQNENEVNKIGDGKKGSHSVGQRHD